MTKYILTVAITALLFTGCGNKKSNEHGHEHDSDGNHINTENIHQHEDGSIHQNHDTEHQQEEFKVESDSLKLKKKYEHHHVDSSHKH